MDPPKPFPILRLPFLAFEEIFKTMHPSKIISFSMISKRTRAIAKLMSFYSKYSIHLSVKNFTLNIGLYGTAEMVSCTYAMTLDQKKIGKIKEKEKDGYIERKIYNYSNNPVEEWKLLCIYVLEIFKKESITFLSMQMDTYVDQNVSLINFLKTNVKSVDECSLYQQNEENKVAENFVYLLNNITINYKLDSWLHLKNCDFDGKIPKSLQELRIYNSKWIGYERLLEIDCKHVILHKNQMANIEWNSFFKKWIAMESHLNLEYLELDRRELDSFRELVLYDIPHKVVDGGVERVMKIFLNINIEISGGIFIRRFDGRTATFFLKYSVFMMSVH